MQESRLSGFSSWHCGQVIMFDIFFQLSKGEIIERQPSNTLRWQILGGRGLCSGAGKKNSKSHEAPQRPVHYPGDRVERFVGHFTERKTCHPK